MCSLFLKSSNKVVQYNNTLSLYLNDHVCTDQYNVKSNMYILVTNQESSISSFKYQHNYF